MNSLNDSISELQSHLRSNGYDVQKPLLNGEVHRFPRGANQSKKNGWYIGWEHLLSSGSALVYCIYGDWKTSERFTFSSTYGLSEVDAIEAQRKKVEFDIIACEIRNKRQQDAKQRATQLWSLSKVITSHPYLTIKKITNPIGIRVLDSSLVIPMRDLDGNLVGLQLINENGEKRFLKGQAVKNAFFVIGHNPDLRNLTHVNLTEGIATGYSVYSAEKKTVICVFTANNIENICRILKERFPLLKIKICADNDQFTEGNPGVTAATRAAKNYNAAISIPQFEDTAMKPTDFNDLHTSLGLAEVRKQLAKANYLADEAPPASQLAEDFLVKRGLSICNKPILLYWQNEFYQYSEGRYIHISAEDLFAGIISFLQGASGTRKKSTTRFANDIVSNMKGLTYIESSTCLPGWKDKSGRLAKDFIPMKNGLFNISKWRAGERNFIEEHNPEFFTTARLPYSYDPNAQCPIWLSFLAEAQPDPLAQKTIQQWFGYNLVNDMSFHKFLIMYGEGANGKTVVCTVLQALLGVENVSSVPLESLDPRRTFPLAATLGKLANIVGEMNATDKTAEGELKKFVAGELMTAERKFGAPFSFIPTARLTYATNVLPRFSDTTDGIWRRILLLPFEVQITDPEKQNRNFVSMDWWQSSNELPGIFNWSLDGLSDLYREKKFTESDSGKKAKEKYRKDSNPTRTFLLENYEQVSGAVISSYNLYKSYEIAMHSQGNKPMASNRFSDEVKKAFPFVELTEHPQTRPLAEVMGGGPRRSRNWLGLVAKPD